MGKFRQRISSLIRKSSGAGEEVEPRTPYREISDKSKGTARETPKATYSPEELEAMPKELEANVPWDLQSTPSLTSSDLHAKQHEMRTRAASESMVQGSARMPFQGESSMSSSGAYTSSWGTENEEESKGMGSVHRFEQPQSSYVSDSFADTSSYPCLGSVTEGGASSRSYEHPTPLPRHVNPFTAQSSEYKRPPAKLSSGVHDGSKQDSNSSLLPHSSYKQPQQSKFEEHFRRYEPNMTMRRDPRNRQREVAPQEMMPYYHTMHQGSGTNRHQHVDFTRPSPPPAEENVGESQIGSTPRLLTRDSTSRPFLSQPDMAGTITGRQGAQNSPSRPQPARQPPLPRFQRAEQQNGEASDSDFGSEYNWDERTVRPGLPRVHLHNLRQERMSGTSRMPRDPLRQIRRSRPASGRSLVGGRSTRVNQESNWDEIELGPMSPTGQQVVTALPAPSIRQNRPRRMCKWVGDCCMGVAQATIKVNLVLWGLCFICIVALAVLLVWSLKR